MDNMAGPPRSAIIVGGGIAGLAAAIALGKAGISVRIVERAAALEPIGAAITMWANAIDALDLLGVGAAVRAGATRIQTMAVFDRTGRAIIGPRIVDDVPHTGATAYLVTRSALQAALMQSIDPAWLTLDCAVSSIDEHESGVVATLADGTRIEADIAIVADGIWSDVATQILASTAHHVGYGGVLALSDATSGAGVDHAAFEYWGVGERFGLFDIGAGRRYWFYMRNEESAVADQLTHQCVEAATRGWPPEIGRAVSATPANRLIPFSVHAKPPPRRLGRGRIICIGDAAHAMEPNLGQGACQAIEDAVAIGALAARQVPTPLLLPAFEKLRIGRVRRFVSQSAQGGLPAHSRSPLTRALLNAILRVLPAGVTNRATARMYALPDYHSLAR